MWTKDRRCLDVIKGGWKLEVPGNPSFKLCRKQSNTSAALRKWNKEIFGHCQTRINVLSEEIEKIQAKPSSESNMREEAFIQQELNTWLSKNESMWRQKSRETWLKDGDRNSKFFHMSTVIRR
jgi:hypothetical protein